MWRTWLETVKNVGFRLTRLISNIEFLIIFPEQKKRLGQQNKSDPTAATETAFETIEELHRPDKFSRLLCALDYAGKIAL